MKDIESQVEEFRWIAIENRKPREVLNQRHGILWAVWVDRLGGKSVIKDQAEQKGGCGSDLAMQAWGHVPG